MDADVLDPAGVDELIGAFRRHFGAVGAAVTTLQLITGLDTEDAQAVVTWAADDPRDDATGSVPRLDAVTGRVRDFERALLSHLTMESPWGR